MYSKTSWVARVGTALNRFLKTNETTGAVELSPDPTGISTAGTPFTTTNMNKIESGIYDAHVTADANATNLANNVNQGVKTTDDVVFDNVVAQTGIQTFGDIQAGGNSTVGGLLFGGFSITSKSTSGTTYEVSVNMGSMQLNELRMISYTHTDTVNTLTSRGTLKTPTTAGGVYKVIGDQGYATHKVSYGSNTEIAKSSTIDSANNPQPETYTIFVLRIG